MSGQDLAIPLFLAALVFFFHGLDSVRAGLKGLASRSVRRRAQTLVASPLRTALVGLGFGAVSQSATAVSMVLSGLVSAGLIPMQRALTMVAWANPGTAVLAFLAAVNMHAATLWLIGLVGLALRNKRLHRAGNTLGAVLGIGFMLFGLVQMKTAAAPAQDGATYAALSSFLGGSLVLAFAAGAVLRIIIQSSSGIAVILIALASRGIIDPVHALVVLHGTAIGIGASVLLLGRGMRGEALRISYFQALVNAFAGLVLGAWMLIADATGLPNLIELLDRLQLGLESTLATGFLAQMLLCPLGAVLLGSRAESLLARLAPESEEQGLARLRYLTSGAAEEPEVALDLVAKESQRFLEATPALLDRARLDAAAGSGLDAKALAESLTTLDAEIDGFLAEVLEQANSPEMTRQYLAASDRQQALGELATNLVALADAVTAIPKDSPQRVLGGLLVESLDTMLRTAIDVGREADPLDRELLQQMTADRSEQMESVRRQAATADAGAPRAQAQVLYATSLFERAVYLLRRVARASSPAQ
jgi:phosphate:Na+ symporter